MTNLPINTLEHAIAYRNDCLRKFQAYTIEVGHAAREHSRLNHKTGRPNKDITVNNVIDALRTHTSVTAAAASMGVSRGFINERVKNPTQLLAVPRK